MFDLWQVCCWLDHQALARLCWLELWLVSKGGIGTDFILNTRLLL